MDGRGDPGHHRVERREPMTTDLTVSLVNRPGTLAQASDAIGRAGVNIEGACGFVCGGAGVYHVLVADAEGARRALIDAGFEIQGQRQVVVAPVENRPGAAAELLRQVADAGVNVDLLYLTVDGRLVIGGAGVRDIRDALG
jgi:hypothetical protein